MSASFSFYKIYRGFSTTGIRKVKLSLKKVCHCEHSAAISWPIHVRSVELRDCFVVPPTHDIIKIKVMLNLFQHPTR
jgi:hypothetical protein